MADIIVLNEITELLNDMNDGLTSTLSTISSNVNTIKTNVASILDYTKTNNTASATGNLSQKASQAVSNTAATTTENASGTLSAKLTYLINRRNKVVVPSSTNLKTFSSNISTGNTAGSKGNVQYAYSNYTDTFAIAYDGTYRFYCTGTVTVTALNANVCVSPSAYNAIGFEIWVNGTTTSVTVVNIDQAKVMTSASTTKTCDLVLKRGDNVKLRIFAASGNSGTSYYSNTANAKATDLSIRGTIREVNAAIV